MPLFSADLTDLEQVVVTAAQMRAIESRVFAAGMPVAALMEKVGGFIAQRVRSLYPLTSHRRVGVLVGPGHNGGDALVVARELHNQGYAVQVVCPFEQLKDLTASHAQYAQHLGIPFHSETLPTVDWLVDGLFGFGLERPITGSLGQFFESINQSGVPIVSIDLPSGLHTNTGEVLGTAIRATHTLCLGLWKQGLLQEPALEYVGQAELIPFGLPWADIQAELAEQPQVRRVTSQSAIAALPLSRPASTHKYQMGHALLICGSGRYAGGAILTSLGARASGVGMLTVAVPESIKPLLNAQLPEALIVGCPETASGAIARLPDELDLSCFDAIACGPGLTLDALPVIQRVLQCDRPLILDADGLNALAQLGTIPILQARTAPTVLTPHLGEFRRLFPDLSQHLNCRVTGTRLAAQQTGAIVLLKGARVVVADPQGQVWINPESTPALARGGSGDVLTGLLAGIWAQGILQQHPLPEMVASAAWWHALAGILAAETRTVLGVDAFTLTQFLLPALQGAIATAPATHSRPG